MNCPECHADLMEDSVYCHACGKRVSGSVPRTSRRHRQDQADPAYPNVRSDRRAKSERTDDLVGPPLKGPTSGRFRNARRRLQSLNPNDEELELWSGTYSAKGMINYWIAAILISIAIPMAAAIFAFQIEGSMLIAFGIVAVVWLVLGGMLLFQKLDVHYELTSQRLVHKVGILRRITNRIEVIDIDDVTFEQGILERVLGVGTIAIYSSDRTDPSMIMTGIDDVYQVFELLDEARRSERVRRGIHIEAV
ncbi:MAG: PH domain-containing protein [Planctomycetales bacterium]|nr:PH domain-containing protein [Planctomycetales bacterium]